mgnify:FL=1
MEALMERVHQHILVEEDGMHTKVEFDTNSDIGQNTFGKS